MACVLALTFGAAACGTSLLLTPRSFSNEDVSRFERAGAALGCHARDSAVFPLFLICPGGDQSLGIAASEGKLSISCPDLRPRRCRKLFARLERAASASETAQPAQRRPQAAARVEP